MSHAVKLMQSMRNFMISLRSTRPSTADPEDRSHELLIRKIIDARRLRHQY